MSDRIVLAGAAAARTPATRNRKPVPSGRSQLAQTWCANCREVSLEADTAARKALYHLGRTSR